MRPSAGVVVVVGMGRDRVRPQVSIMLETCESGPELHRCCAVCVLHRPAHTRQWHICSVSQAERVAWGAWGESRDPSLVIMLSPIPPSKLLGSNGHQMEISPHSQETPFSSLDVKWPSNGLDPPQMAPTMRHEGTRLTQATPDMGPQRPSQVVGTSTLPNAPLVSRVGRSRYRPLRP